jgi:uncharacterized protein (TIGR02145 family)
LCKVNYEAPMKRSIQDVRGQSLTIPNSNQLRELLAQRWSPVKFKVVLFLLVLSVTAIDAAPQPVSAYVNLAADTLVVDPLLTQGLADRDGNRYKTVKIGAQVWMAENLKSSTLNDGTPIAKVIYKGIWKTTTAPAFCFYDDSETNKQLYGALYNWYSVETNKLCPVGWHVPTVQDFNELNKSINCSGESGGCLSLLPGGSTRFNSQAGGFNDPNHYYGANNYAGLGAGGHYWTATQQDSTIVVVYISAENYHWGKDAKNIGNSIRCLKD